MGEISNYRRFYGLLKRLPPECSGEEGKEILVSGFTDGRTTHLHDMTRGEYNALCAYLEREVGLREQRKKKRSLCLKLMQKAGIDTTDWARINEFCANPKIAGKVFAKLRMEELEALQMKLRAILRKGGLKKDVKPQEHQGQMIELRVLGSA